MKTKKWAPVTAVVIFGFIVSNGCARCADMDSLKKAVEVEIASSGAEVSLAFKNLQTGETLCVKEKDMVHAASTMKVAVLIEVFKQAEDGRFHLSDRIVVKNAFHSIVDGSPFSLNPEDDSDTGIYGLIGTALTIRELAGRMITVSSNLATNMLIELVRPENIMSTLRLLGVRRLRVLRGVEDGKAFEKGWNNQTDALSLLRVMEAIASGEAGSSSSCGEMISILEKQQFRNGIPAGLPSGMRVANKTGSIAGMEHDAAIVFPPGRKPCLLVIMTRGVKSGEEGERVIARLAEIIFDRVLGGSAG